MQKISPFLWFNNNAEEATQFFTGASDVQAVDLPEAFRQPSFDK